LRAWFAAGGGEEISLREQSDHSSDNQSTDAGLATPPGSLRTRRFIFVAALTGLAFWLARDFLPALTWAIVITVTAWPLYHRVVPVSPNGWRKVIAPLLFTFLAGLLLLLPLAWIGREVAREAQSVMNWFAEAQKHGINAPDWLARLPLVGDRATAWWQANLSSPEAASRVLSRLDMGRLAGWMGGLGAALANTLLLFLLTFLGLFFLLRDGERLGRWTLGVADRLLGEPGARFAERLVAALRGTVAGTVLVALGEGALIGTGYVVTGVPQPILLGALTFVFAMLPLGAWVVFTVASLILVASGSVLAGFGLFGFGAVVMFVGDNFVQPALIGDAIRLPFLMTLIGIFGGVEVFGVVGLFLGPVVMAAVVMVWREWVDVDPQILTDRRTR
jgi:predicted PurR-regulated permease PerM